MTVRCWVWLVVCVCVAGLAGGWLAIRLDEELKRLQEHLR